MDNASLQAVHHTVAMVMGQEVPHDGCGEVTQAVGNDVRLEGLQEDSLSNRVFQQPVVQLVEHQVSAHGKHFYFCSVLNHTGMLYALTKSSEIQLYLIVQLLDLIQLD